MKTVEYKILMDEAALAASSATEILDVYTKNGYAIQVTWVDGGALAGSIKLQASVDGVNFVDITSSSQVVAGSSGYVWNVDAVYYRYVKAYITIGAGVGSFVVVANSKGF